VPTRIGRHAYRVVQEGLTNARKHAFDTRVHVMVDTTDDGLTLEISNPMPLVDPNREPRTMPGAGTGLIGLAERVQLVGGQLEYGQGEAGTFRLFALLPWRR
jgi:signal transduction histidine kinase